MLHSYVEVSVISIFSWFFFVKHQHFCVPACCGNTGDRTGPHHPYPPSTISGLMSYGMPLFWVMGFQLLHFMHGCRQSVLKYRSRRSRFPRFFFLDQFFRGEHFKFPKGLSEPNIPPSYFISCTSLYQLNHFWFPKECRGSTRPIRHVLTSRLRCCFLFEQSYTSVPAAQIEL